MNDLILFMFACVSLTQIIGRSTIMASLRAALFARVPFLYELLTCAMCSGFWYGVGASFFLSLGITRSVAFALVTSLVAYAVALTLDLMDAIVSASYRVADAAQAAYARMDGDGIDITNANDGGDTGDNGNGSDSANVH